MPLSFAAARAALLLIVALGLPAAAQAADWQLVLSDHTRRVEIDRGSIFSSDAGTRVAWGRVVLSNDEAARQGYAMVKALNRYDCQRRSFVTVKRVYVDADEHLLSEEAFDDSAAMVAVKPNSVDERMWREVCRPQGGGGGAQPAAGSQVHRVAAEIQRLVAAMENGERTQFAPDPAPRLTPPPAPAALGRAAAAPVSAPLVAAPPPVPTSPVPASSPDPLDELLQVQLESQPPRSTVAARDWAYEGEHGPAAWGQLRPEWALCSQGQRQAPVSLEGSLAVQLEPVRRHYRHSGFSVRDDGRTLTVHTGEGMGMEVRGLRYVLESFTLHRPAAGEAGRIAHDLALYFHHRSIDGQAAIMVVMLRADGMANALLDTLWSNLPLEQGSAFTPAALLDLGAFMPRSEDHFLYMGSLPAPPCTEDVLWVVMKEVQAMSSEQLELFARLYPPNARPPQAAHGRLILESR